LLELAERLGPDSKVWGLDSWEPALQRAKEKFRLRGLSNIEITHSPAESMPFEDDCFDLIVSNNGLNNVQDPRLVLQQCKRVARVGCQLVFTANLPGTFGNFYQAFENSLEARGLSDQISALHSHIAAKRKPVTAWIDLARAAGWSVMSIRRSSFSWGFSCCAAFLSHWFIRLAFLPSWLEIMPEDQRNGILKDIEADLDSQAKARGGLNMEVPFFCIDAQSLP
jgi:SAM-dependent methyltransferase